MTVSASEPADDPHVQLQREPLPHNVKVLGAVSLAQDTGSEMLYPLLPTFVTGTLGAAIRSANGPTAELD